MKEKIAKLTGNHAALAVAIVRSADASNLLSYIDLFRTLAGTAIPHVLNEQLDQWQFHLQHQAGEAKERTERLLRAIEKLTNELMETNGEVK